MHPLCLSIPLHPSIPLSWWDGWWWTCVRNRGREGRIIPPEYMMNVVIGLKGTGGGQVAHWEQERACEWQRAPSPAPCCSFSQSLYPPPWRERQRIRQLTRQSKGRLKPCFLCCFVKNICKSEPLEVRGKRQGVAEDAHLVIQPTQSVSKLQHQRGGERMLNNMTDCEEGEGGPNSQSEWSNLLQTERGLCRGVCGHESAW